MWSDALLLRRSGAINQPLDWDGDGATDTELVSVDLNLDGVCIKAGDNKKLDSKPAKDDLSKRRTIYAGENRTCDTEVAGDDEAGTAAEGTMDYHRAVAKKVRG